MRTPNVQTNRKFDFNEHCISSIIMEINSSAASSGVTIFFILVVVTVLLFHQHSSVSGRHTLEFNSYLPPSLRTWSCWWLLHKRAPYPRFIKLIEKSLRKKKLHLKPKRYKICLEFKKQFTVFLFSKINKFKSASNFLTYF